MIQKEVILNRVLKLSGAFVKAVGYVFHFFFPDKRFTIPKFSEAKRKSKQNSLIPKNIWQTNFTNKVTLPVYVNYLVIRLLSPEYNYNYVSTEDRDRFMKENTDEKTYEAFSKLTDGAAQADFWRVFVLNTKGGVYLDIDAHPVWFLSDLIKPDFKELILLNKEHYTNYFMASAPDNPILEKALEIMIENIEQKRVEKGVYYLTGPVVLNKAISELNITPNHRFYRVTCVQGSFTNEHFQYIDKKRGKWTHKDVSELLKNGEES